MNSVSGLYIPVWIDLKTVDELVDEHESALHSSMDRFKVNIDSDSCHSVLPLHSSMDRFKACISFASYPAITALHSSMDRFKGIGKTARCLSCFGQCVLSICLVICIYFFYLFINFFKTAYCSDFSPLSTYGVFCFIWG